MTVEYLSPEWFTEADEAVAALSPIPTAVTVTVTVTDGPRDRPDVRYELVLGPDRVRIIGGANRDGNVSLTMSYRVAAAIAQGETGAQRAFLDGEVRLGGDTTMLLGHQEQLARIEDRLSDLRARTRY